jgi:hypothetical protein
MMMLILSLSYAVKLRAGQLRHIDLGVLGKHRLHGEEQGGGEDRRVERLHRSFLLGGFGCASATLAVLLVASKKSRPGRFATA